MKKRLKANGMKKVTEMNNSENTVYTSCEKRGRFKKKYDIFTYTQKNVFEIY